MSAVQLVAYGSVNVVDNLTRFLSVSGQLFANQATEANAEVPIRDAGTVSHLFARVISNTATNGSTVTVRKSQADTAVTLSVGGDATGEFEDTSNSVSFANTDELDIEVTVATEGGTNTITFSLVGVVFTAASGTASVIGASGQQNFATASTTAFWALGDRDIAAVDEARHEWAVRSSFTASNLYVVVSANSRTTNTVVKSRKNRGDGAMSVTYGNVETGTKEDTSNSDSLVSGDEYNCAVTTSTGTQTITFQNHCVRVSSSDNRYPLIACGSVTQAANVTNYLGPGDVNVATTTESTAQMRSRFAATLRELAVHVSGNTITTTPSVCAVRVNGSNSSVAVSYAAAETGQKVDSSNTVALDADDLYAFLVSTPNTSGALTYTHVSVIGEVASSSFVPFPRPRGMSGGMSELAGGMAA